MGQDILHHDPRNHGTIDPQVLSRPDIERDNAVVGLNDANLCGACRALKELPIIVLRRPGNMRLDKVDEG
jgi:hypothetical protein